MSPTRPNPIRATRITLTAKVTLSIRPRTPIASQEPEPVVRRRGRLERTRAFGVRRARCRALIAAGLYHLCPRGIPGAGSAVRPVGEPGGSREERRWHRDR